MRSTSSRKPIVGLLSPTRHYRECLTRALSSSREFSIVDVGRCDPVDLDRLENLKPEVVLLDLAGAQAIPLVRRMGALLPSAALVALNGGDDESQTVGLFEAGLAGYTPSDASVEDLQEIIGFALRHELHYPPHVAEAILRRLRELDGHRKAAVRSDHLSARELSVLELIEQGLTNKEIAFRLGIEPATVKNHVHAILKKLAVHRRGEAVSHLRHPELRVVRGDRSGE
jgi:DNA-binding NarL/FixJ family response regulator